MERRDERLGIGGMNRYIYNGVAADRHTKVPIIRAKYLDRFPQLLIIQRIPVMSWSGHCLFHTVYRDAVRL